MDPQYFMAPTNPLGSPAPLWFILFFKVVGFILHLYPMNLLLAGVPLAAILLLRGSDLECRASKRLAIALPFVVALAVNFGIVPLLFVQVSYYKVFYPATILIAWLWFCIPVLLTFAYYGIYAYSYQVKYDRLTRFGRNSIVFAAVAFPIMAFIFANGFTLMANPGAWEAIFARTQVSAAVTGFGHNFGDLTVWLRWVLMIGMACLTVASWLALDTAVLDRDGDEAYAGFARGLAVKVGSLGLGLMAVSGGWYLAGAMPDSGREALFSGGMMVVTLLTLVSPALTLAALMLNQRRASVGSAYTVLGCQLLVIALNAISRQVVQNAEIAPLGILTADPVHTQWSTLPLFLACFVFALAIILWMLRQVWLEVSANRETPTEA